MRVRYKVGKDVVTFNGYYNRTQRRIRGLTGEEVAAFVKSCAARKDFTEVTMLEADLTEEENRKESEEITKLLGLSTPKVESDSLVESMTKIWKIVLKQ